MQEISLPCSPPRSPPRARRAQRAHDVAGCRRDAGRPDDRGDCRKNAPNLLGVDLEDACSRQIEGIRAGGASTAMSAAMRTSINVSASRLDASIEAAVIPATRSRTGVSVVPAMGAPFGRFGARSAAASLEPFLRDPYFTQRGQFPSSRWDEGRMATSDAEPVRIRGLSRGCESRMRSRSRASSRPRPACRHSRTPRASSCLRAW